MTNSEDMRWWYVPLEIVMLRRWLVAAFIMNVLLLTVDYLRAESDHFSLASSLAFFSQLFAHHSRMSMTMFVETFRSS